MVPTQSESEDTDMSIRSAKKELRKSMKAMLKTLHHDNIANQSQIVISKIQSTSWYASAQNICVYLSMDSGELITDDLVIDALNKGKNVYVPYCSFPREPFVMKMFRLRSMEEYLGLEANPWGIREHVDDGHLQDAYDADSEGLDVLLMPGLAWDQQANRLGYGKGFYDRFLTNVDMWTKTREKPFPLTAPTKFRTRKMKGMMKAVNRMPHLVTSKIGMANKSSDAETEELKRRFTAMETYADKLLKDATVFRDSITTTPAMVDSSSKYSESFLAIFTPMGNEYNLEGRYPSAATTIQQIGSYQTEMTEMQETLKPEIELIESRIIAPAKEFIESVKKIRKFIVKRDHKLIDYDRHNNSYTKLRDKQNKSLSDEKNLFKVEQDYEQAAQDYEMHNNSLKEDLPKFFVFATNFITPLFQSFYYMQLQCIYVMLEKYQQFTSGKFDLSIDVESAYRNKLGDAAEQVDSLTITRRFVSTAHMMKHANTRSPPSSLNRNSSFGSSNSAQAVSPSRPPVTSKPSFTRTLPPSASSSAGAAMAPPPYTSGGVAAAVPASGMSKRPPPPPPAKKPVIAAGPPTCVALYDYEAQADGDLSFAAGETIEIIEKSDSAEDWWSGRIGARSGQFPANYVQLQ